MWGGCDVFVSSDGGPSADFLEGHQAALPFHFCHQAGFKLPRLRPVSWRGRCQSSTNHFYLLPQTLHTLFIVLSSLCMHHGLILQCCRCFAIGLLTARAQPPGLGSGVLLKWCLGYVVGSRESLFGSSAGSQRRNFLYLLGNSFLQSPAEVCPARCVSRQLPRAVYLVGMLCGSYVGNCLKMHK